MADLIAFYFGISQWSTFG